MKQALEQDDLAAFARALNSLFASIPYLSLGKTVKAVGFNFNSEQKTLDQW